MEQRKYGFNRLLPSEGLILVLIFLSVSVSVVHGYKNYTVGDSSGWFDKLAKPAVDYPRWAAGKNFSLGDFLIFNTDNNHSVVQTYNFTTYKLCDYNDALENDTIEWSAGDPSATTPHAVTVSVPLVKQGMNYFFSGNYDGEQCKHGQHFKINVTYGQGLPKGFKEPSDESPAPTSPDSGDDSEAAPDTIVPSNFDNPRDEPAADKEASGSASLTLQIKTQGMKLNKYLFLLVGLACLF